MYTAQNVHLTKRNRKKQTRAVGFASWGRLRFCDTGTGHASNEKQNTLNQVGFLIWERMRSVIR